MASQQRVLVVGVGSIGERHVRCFQATGRADVSICEVNAELCRLVAERYGVARSYQQLDDALADPHDAVVIATPAHLHIAMAQQAAEAGCGLLIEKPLSVRLDDAAAFCAAAKSHGVVAAVAYVNRAHPALAAMKRAIDAGRFGRPLQLVAVCGQNFPTYRPAYREIYYRDHATGGGAIQDALTHVVNAGQWLSGPRRPAIRRRRPSSPARRRSGRHRASCGPARRCVVVL